MIGKLLAHAQVQTTACYAHRARDSIQTAAARITESIGGNLLGDQSIGKSKNRFPMASVLCRGQQIRWSGVQGGRLEPCMGSDRII